MIDDFDGSGGVLGVGVVSDMDLLSSFIQTNTCCEGSTFEYVGTAYGWDLTYSTLDAQDLSLDGSLAIDVLAVVPNGGPAMVTVTANGSSSTGLITLNVGTNVIPYLDFSDAEVFSSLTSLKFEFESIKPYAMTIDRIHTPEPATAMMLGLGLMGLAVSSRRQVA